MGDFGLEMEDEEELLRRGLGFCFWRVWRVGSMVAWGSVDGGDG